MQKIHEINAFVVFLLKVLLKQKITLFFLFFTLVLIAISIFFNNSEIGEKNRFFLTILITFESNLLLIFSVLYSFTLLQKESANSLFILPLSLGMSRLNYLLTIFLTIFSLNLLFFVLFILINFITFFAIQPDILSKFFILSYQIFLYTLSAILLSFFVILFSQFTSFINAVAYAIFVFLIGNGLDELSYFVNYLGENNLLIYKLHEILYFIIPNFYIFDFSNQIIANINIEHNKLLLPLLYFVIESVIIFMFTYLKFKNKVLKIEN
jgi:fucose 4-O-acetylase-like acetyltransferase